jgi:hypothetical protein
MAVIMLMGLLVAIGLPALMSFRGTAVSSGGRGVANSLSLARQYAITQRRNTRVVFYYSGTTEEGTGLNARLRKYNQYGVFVACPTNIASWGNVAWNQVGHWENLSLGAVFADNRAPEGGALDSLRNGRMVRIWTTLVNGVPQGRAQWFTYAYVEFQPTGEATPPLSMSNRGTISVYEGGKDNDTGEIRYALNKNRVNIVYDSLTGRVRLQR